MIGAPGCCCWFDKLSLELFAFSHCNRDEGSPLQHENPTNWKRSFRGADGCRITCTWNDSGDTHSVSSREPPAKLDVEGRYESHDVKISPGPLVLYHLPNTAILTNPKR